jgi:hypothetical protein
MCSTNAALRFLRLEVCWLSVSGLGVVGFWQAATGKFIGRVSFHLPCDRCITEGAKGLPSWLQASEVGWRFEIPTALGIVTG